MKLNLVSPGIMLIGTTVKKIIIDNNIIDTGREAKRTFGLNINEPEFEEDNNSLYAQMNIDMEIEVQQSEDQRCKLQLTVEGVFLADEVEEERFKELVVINGAAALIGIARGKIEAITANIFNNGKITIPFVNVIDYYKGSES